MQRIAVLAIEVKSVQAFLVLVRYCVGRVFTFRPKLGLYWVM